MEQQVNIVPELTQDMISQLPQELISKPTMWEKPLLKKMQQEYEFFGGLSLLYAVLTTFCLYGNENGITFPLYVLITIVCSYYLLKRIDYKVQTFTLPYVAGMMLLGISTVFTNSDFLRLFNYVGIFLLFITGMIHQFYNDKAWSFPCYLKRIVVVMGITVAHCVTPFIHGFHYFSEAKSRKKRTITAVLLGVLIAIGLLTVIMPLLMGSDMVFREIFNRMLYGRFHIFTMFGITVMFVLAFVACYSFFGALCSCEFPVEERKMKYFNSIVGITFTGIIAGIYLMYSGVQVLYLFMKIGGGLPEGYTYSMYARQGFWQLLFVGIINFVMVIFCLYLFKENNVLRVILTVISGCTFLMMVSAAYRMLLYVGEYHLTMLRILVLWFLLVLALIMGGVIVSIYRKSFHLFRYVAVVVGCCYIVLSFARPDKIIVNYNLNHMDEINMSDVNYLIYGTSIDAAPELAKLDMEKLTAEDGADYEGESIIYWYFRDIVETQKEGFSLRKINVSKMQAENAAEKWLETYEETHKN